MNRNERGFIVFICLLLGFGLILSLGISASYRAHKEEVVVEEPTYVEKVFKTQTFQGKVMIDTVKVDGQVYVVAISSNGLSIIPSASCNCIER